MSWRVIAAIVLLIAGLGVADHYLAATEASEVRNAARQSYLTGSRLWRQNNPQAALDLLRNAHALERDNAEYELQLAGVLLSLNKSNDAEPLLEEMLQLKPNDGRANLLSGRLALMEGDSTGAKAYYHRAIFGDWPRDGHTNSTAARLELIRLLTRERDRQQLRSELISLDAEAANDPHDIKAWTALGEAELELGDYRAARADFEHTANAQRLALVGFLAGLDPTARRLPSRVKYNRSLRILEMAKADLEHRAPNPVETPAPGSVNNEAAEQVLAVAEGIWKHRLATQGPVTPDEEPLRLMMDKLSK